VSNSEAGHPGISGIINTILLVSLILVLPGIRWTIFGWLQILLPLLTFFLLSRYGMHIGNRLLLSALALAFVIYLVMQRIDFFFLSLSLIPVGYVLVHAANQKDSPAMSGLKGSLTLTVCWIIAFTGLSIGSEISFYSQLINTLDAGITEALYFYRANTSISSETLMLLESTLLQMKIIVPIIMPAMLGSFVLLITWFTMVVGNRLVLKSCGNAPWIQYSQWQLPDRLIWVIILLGILTLISAYPVRKIGINGLILLSIVYCFQGMAIGVFFMHKWNIPIVFRVFFYVMIVFQSFGTVLLLFLGIADIWFNFRKLHVPIDDTTE
jgi:hypothetical protein